MAYTTKNYKTKKELVEDFKAGKAVYVYQPGGLFPLSDGEVWLEGPHYPQPHKWYVKGEQQGGQLTRIYDGRKMLRQEVAR